MGSNTLSKAGIRMKQTGHSFGRHPDRSGGTIDRAKMPLQSRLS